MLFGIHEFKSNIPVLLLISSSALVSLDVFSKLLLIWTIGSMIRVHNSKTFVDIPLPLVDFLLPSLGYVVPWIRTIPVPLQYFETHYRWLDFWEYGWNGVSLDTVTACSFCSRSFGKRNVARPERFGVLDRIRGCADRERIVSGVFQLVFVHSLFPFFPFH